MYINVIGAAIAFALGAAVSFINHLISKRMLLRSPDKLALSTTLRSAIQVLFITLVYFIGRLTPADIWYLLIGAVIGLSVFSILFTYKLLKLNRETTELSNDDQDKEE